MIGLALLAASSVAAGQPVHEAERAFASMAQTHGQWTAFRAFMTPDAITLTPAIVKAAPLLAKAKDPPVPIMWWPARSVTACDGSLALSTGPWRADGGKSSGRFYSMWQKQPDGGWKWIYDGGATTNQASPAGDPVKAKRAACRLPSAPAPAIGSEAGGVSADGTLRWGLDPAPDKKHRLRIAYSTGKAWEIAEDAIVG